MFPMPHFIESLECVHALPGGPQTVALLYKSSKIALRLWKVIEQDLRERVVCVVGWISWWKSMMMR